MNKHYSAYYTTQPYIPFNPDYPDGKGKYLRLWEPLIQKLDDSNIVTVNNFNAHIWNSTNVFITDIDLNLGNPESENPPLTTAIHAVRGAAMSAGLGLRLYETRGGLRVILSSAAMSCNTKAIQLMQAIVSDPKYVGLCEATKTYRARLTAKPIGPVPPPMHCAVTRYLETVGLEKVNNRIAPIIEFHDTATKALSGIRTLV